MHSPPADPLKSGWYAALGTLQRMASLPQQPQQFSQDWQQLQQNPSQFFAGLVTEGAVVAEALEATCQQFSGRAWGDRPLPKYINRPNDQSFLQPYELKNTQLFGFVLEGSLAQLQKLCDRSLNQPADGSVHYQVAIPYVILSFQHMGRVSSLNPPDANRGFLSEKEVAIWVLTLAGKKCGPVFRAERLAWFIPYMFASNEPIIASGREVCGFPKELGKFKLPDLNQLTQPAHLQALTWKTLSPQTPARWETLIQVQAAEPQSEPIKRWQTAAEAGRHLVELLLSGQNAIDIPGWELPFSLADDLLTGEVPIVLLKQFRDVVRGDRACYQAIVETPAQLTALQAGGLLGAEHLGYQFTVAIGQFASHPLVQDLGLTTQGSSLQPDSPLQVPVKFAFWVDFDFQLQNGQIIWEARR
ncbi:hypothetical protein [Almyronema epifaneia]|uniref:Uncharacterized protein n=1 Tax=Almyronema epifaneia S1 TaxID=2991925 RepID=A0ABW6IGF2_9CYAN